MRRFSADLKRNQADLGYALLLLPLYDHPASADPCEIDAAAWSTVPNVPVFFWCFRLMVGLGLYFIALFATAFLSGDTPSALSGIPVSQARFLQLAPALDRHRSGLDCRRVRQANLGRSMACYPSIPRRYRAPRWGNVWLSLSGFVIFYLCFGRRGRLSSGAHRYDAGLTDWDTRREHAAMSYEILRVIWWLLLGVLLVGFAITDGFDLGLGASFTFLGRTDAERRALLASVERFGKEIRFGLCWAAGRQFAAWPLLYAACSKDCIWPCFSC